MEFTVVTVIVALLGVFLIGFMKGAFGGGFPIVGVPLLPFVMDPVLAATKHSWAGTSRWLT